MKALSKLKAEEGIWMTDVPVPELGHNDLLIKIRKTAICGTDVHIYNWDEWSQKTIPVPMVVGHEYVGEVVGIGQEVKGFKIGDRVSGEGHITCGHCRNCRGGRTHLCRNTIGVGDIVRDFEGVERRNHQILGEAARTISPTTWLPFLIPSVTLCIPRCRSIWLARMCWSLVQVR